MALFRRIVKELEKPRDQRPLGSGWVSGSLSLLAGLAALLIIAVRMFPQTFTFPELDFIHQSQIVTFALRAILLLGYALALVSLLLSRSKVLGWAGLALAIIASLIGNAPAQLPGETPQILYFGLDYFIVNVLVIGFVFVPLERFFPARSEQTVFRPEWDEDLFYYLVSSMLVQILTFITMAPSDLVNATAEIDNIRSYFGSQPFVLQVIVIMFFTDFVQYWVHRIFHMVPFLWRFHSIHHSTKRLDWLAGARMHFLEIAVLRGLTAVPMFTLGFRPEAIQAYLLVVYFYSSFIHANIGWRFGGVERLLVTPRFHHWHHGSERAAIDINYASHFPIFDWLFGTYHLPDGAWPEKYGVAGEDVPHGYFRQLIYPFQKQRKVKKAKPSSGS